MTAISKQASLVSVQLGKTADNFMIQGLKALIVDPLTIHFLSLMTTQTSMEKDMFISNIMISGLVKHQSSPNVSGVIFVTPTEENISVIVEALQKPKFAQFYINFTMDISETQIKHIAEADKFHLVQSCRVLYSSYFPVHKNLVETPKGVDSFVSFVRAYGCQPAIVRYSKTKTCEEAADRIASAFREQKPLPYDQFGHQPNQPSRTPVQILVVDKKDDLRSLFQPYLSYQAVISSAFRIGSSGRAIDVPHNYFTIPERFRVLFDIDSYEAVKLLGDISQQVLSQKPAPLETTMSPDAIQEFLEKSQQYEANSISINNYHKLNVHDKFKDVLKYLFNIQLVNTELMDNSKSPKQMLDTMKNTVEGLIKQAEMKQMQEIPVKQAVIQLLSYTALCVAANFQIILQDPANNIQLIDQTKYQQEVSILFNILFKKFTSVEPTMQVFCEQILGKVSNLVVRSNIDWSSIYQQGVLAEEKIAKDKMWINFQRPDFMTLLETADLEFKDAAQRYANKPYIVSLAEAVMMYTLSEDLYPILGEYVENYSKFKTEQLMTTTIIYQIGGASFDDACALGNWSYYGHQGRGKKQAAEEQLAESARLTNSQIILATDKIVSFIDQLEDFCGVSKNVPGLESINFI